MNRRDLPLDSIIVFAHASATVLEIYSLFLYFP